MKLSLICLIILIVHILLLIIMRLYAAAAFPGIRARVFSAALIPVFGPVAGVLSIRSSKRDKDFEWLREIVNADVGNDYDIRRVDGDFTAFEEVLSLNEGKDRRRIMLDLLRQDAKPYLQVIRLAASNDDVDTSHYATATMMQLESDFQKNISEMSRRVSSSGATETDARNYIDAVSEYINSGLLDENRCSRYRTVLEGSYSRAINDYGCSDLVPAAIDNLVALGNISGAMILCDREINSGHINDELCKRRLQLYVSAQDEGGLKDFIAKVRAGKANLSPELRDLFSFWECGNIISYEDEEDAI